ncbi:MAG: DUF3187 family protein [Luminiphilus sp.]|nr:DUF3187 family protein [Luminiphilus sp.]
MVRQRGLVIAVVFVALAPRLAVAERVHAPLWVENLSPMAALIGIPSQRTADIREGLSVTAHTDLATHFVAQASDNEQLFFDGESQRQSLRVRWGLSSVWELSATLPVTRHSGGFVDSYVNRWHSAFGMSDGGRSAVPEDQIRYQFDSLTQALSLARSASGRNDLTFELAHIAERQKDLQIAYAIGYKASTGNVDEWTGSGASDVYSVARFSGAHQSDLPFYWHGQLGVTHVGSSPLLGPRQKEWIGFAGLSMEWLLNSHWALLAQFDSHSAILNSDLKALGEPAGMLSLGLRRSLGRHWALDVSFAEDIVVESAPDIIFQASLHYRP